MNLSARNRLLVIGLAVAAVVLLVVGIIYIGDHPKRSLAAFALALACGVGAAWFVVRRPAPE